MKATEVTTINIKRTVISSVTTIFLIDCLGEGDKQTARTRHEGICDTLLELSSQDSVHLTSRVYHERCKHRDDWKVAMDKVRDMSKQGILPLVFIDGHGDAQRGLQMPAGGFVSWADYNQDLRAIMYAARGELAVIAAFCHSFAFVDRVAKVGEKLPFAFYFGYEDLVLTSVVDRETEMIYGSLLRDGGASLNFDQLQMSRYDEYDHAINLLAPAIMMRIAPKTLVERVPEYSKAQLRAKLERDLAKEGVRLGEVRRAIKKAMRNTTELARGLIESSMHETERRRKFIKIIQSEMRKHSIEK